MSGGVKKRRRERYEVRDDVELLARFELATVSHGARPHGNPPTSRLKKRMRSPVMRR